MADWSHVVKGLEGFPPEAPVDPAIFARIAELKKQLGDDLMILGHHYQRDEIIQFADVTGDSFELSRHAAANHDAKFIVFCGVHFMAETANILAAKNQVVILPDLEAGCSMADMANIDQVNRAWADLTRVTTEKIIPITYMNSAASLKAFCGERDGAVCTSSNAAGILKWAFSRGDKVFFFPDQHLGRNTGYRMGYPLDEMILWDPFQPRGGQTPAAIQQAKIILWKGFCSVHMEFQPEYIHELRQKHPGLKVLVHPECTFNVCQQADDMGSTGYIIKMVEQAEPGTIWAIGTEHHLVDRLQKQHPEQTIMSLSPFSCACSTMYRIDPHRLLYVLERLADGEIRNPIKVEPAMAQSAKKALERMLAIPK